MQDENSSNARKNSLDEPPTPDKPDKPIRSPIQPSVRGWTGITAIGQSGKPNRITGANPRDIYQE